MKLISTVFFLVLLSYISTVFVAVVLVELGVELENAKNIFLILLGVSSLILLLLKLKSLKQNH